MTTIDLATKILNRFEPLDIFYSLDIVYYLSAQTEAVKFKGEVFPLATLLRRLYGGRHPREVVLSFYGGPPTKGHWMLGTLYQLLVDHVALYIANNGYEETRRAFRHGK